MNQMSIRFNAQVKIVSEDSRLTGIIISDESGVISEVNIGHHTVHTQPSCPSTGAVMEGNLLTM